MVHLSEVLGCLQRGHCRNPWETRTICVKRTGLLNGIEMIAINRHRACNVARATDARHRPAARRLRDRGPPHNNSEACAAAAYVGRAVAIALGWRKNQRAEEEEPATLITVFRG